MHAMLVLKIKQDECIAAHSLGSLLALLGSLEQGRGLGKSELEVG